MEQFQKEEALRKMKEVGPNAYYFNLPSYEVGSKGQAIDPKAQEQVVNSFMEVGNMRNTYLENIRNFLPEYTTGLQWVNKYNILVRYYVKNYTPISNVGLLLGDDNDFIDVPSSNNKAFTRREINPFPFLNKAVVVKSSTDTYKEGDVIIAAAPRIEPINNGYKDFWYNGWFVHPNRNLTKPPTDFGDHFGYVIIDVNKILAIDVSGN